MCLTAGILGFNYGNAPSIAKRGKRHSVLVLVTHFFHQYRFGRTTSSIYFRCLLCIGTLVVTCMFTSIRSAITVRCMLVSHFPPVLLLEPFINSNARQQFAVPSRSGSCNYSHIVAVVKTVGKMCPSVSVKYKSRR